MIEKTKTRVLVTGANSMLGVNVLERLIALGYKPVAMVRHVTPEFGQLDVEVVLGNVTKIDDLRRAAVDCQSIIHIAAATDQHFLSLKEYLPINVESVKLVCNIAKECGVRLVLVSSANTVGNGTLTRFADESFAPSQPFSKNLYAKSKILAEQAALTAGAEVVIINPTFIIGAHDTKPSSGQAVVIAYGKSIIFAPSGGKNFVAARDVASAIVAAITLGVAGQRYLAAGPAAGNLSFSEFYATISRISEKPTIILKIPRWTMLIAGMVGSLLRFLRIRTQVSITNMDILATREYYSSSRAVTELGMSQTPIEDALRESIEWFKNNNMVKSK